MLEAERIRDRLRSHLGDDRYARFVMRVPDTSQGTRLLFWQQRAWKQFVAANPDCQLDFAQIVDVFAGCPLYGARTLKRKYHLRVKSWLRGPPLSVEDAESEHMVSDARLGPVAVAFGFQNERWLKIKSQLQEGDTLRRFRSPPDTWANLAGQQGIALLRNGEVVDTIVTLMN